MKVIIALAVILVAEQATAAEFTSDLRAKLDRFIDEKTRQVCTDQQNAGPPAEADDCFATTKPIIKRDLEEAFQTFQQWQAESVQEKQQPGNDQRQSGAKR